MTIKKNEPTEELIEELVEDQTKEPCNELIEGKGIWSMLISAWKFLDGKKTILGTACLILSAYLQGLIETVKSCQDPWQLVILILAYNGTFLTAGGGAHKYIKSKNQPA